MSYIENKRIIPFVCLLLILLVLIWSIYKQDGLNNKPQIRIGALLSLTGKISTLGEDVKNGIEVFKVVNGNNRVNLVYEDNAGDPKGALLGAQRLIDSSQVNAIVSGPGSSANSALTPEMDKRKIPFIAVTSHLDTSSDYIIKAHPDIEPEIVKIASRILDDTKGEVGVVYDSASEAQVGAAKLFERIFNDKNRKVTLEGVAINSTNDYRTNLTKYNNSYEAIFILPNEKNAGVIVKQLRLLGFGNKIYGWSVVQGDEFFKTAGTSAEGIIITDHPFLCDRNDEAREYCTQYKKRFKSSPLIYGAYMYDVMNILSSVSVTDSDRGGIDKLIVDAFTSKVYEGISGTLNFDEYGNIKKMDFVFKKATNGEFIVVD